MLAESLKSGGFYNVKRQRFVVDTRPHHSDEVYEILDLAKELKDQAKSGNRASYAQGQDAWV